METGGKVDEDRNTHEVRSSQAQQQQQARGRGGNMNKNESCVVDKHRVGLVGCISASGCGIVQDKKKEAFSSIIIIIINSLESSAHRCSRRSTVDVLTQSACLPARPPARPPALGHVRSTAPRSGDLPCSSLISCPSFLPTLK